jgi:hypothetical protein
MIQRLLLSSIVRQNERDIDGLLLGIEHIVPIITSTTILYSMRAWRGCLTKDQFKHLKSCMSKLTNEDSEEASERLEVLAIGFIKRVMIEWERERSKRRC